MGCSFFKFSEVYTGFQVINVFKLNTQELLASQIPAYVVSAVLTDIPQEKIESVLRLILIRLKQVCKNASELSRYHKQLIILSRLRKFEGTATKIVNDMPITYDIKGDYLYKEGIKEGIKEGEDKGIDKGIDQQATITVINLLVKTNFTKEQIADLAAIPVSFVDKWQKALRRIKAKTIWKSFGTIEDNTPKATERTQAIAIALFKIKLLSDKIIGKVCNLTEAKVKKLRLDHKKKADK